MRLQKNPIVHVDKYVLKALTKSHKPRPRIKSGRDGKAEAGRAKMGELRVQLSSERKAEASGLSLAAREIFEASHHLERAAYALAGETDRGRVTRLMLLSQELQRVAEGLEVPVDENPGAA